MARSVADVLSAHGLRGQVPHIPTCSGGFDQQESTILSVSLGVHPPCRRGWRSTNPQRIQIKFNLFLLRPRMRLVINLRKVLEIQMCINLCCRNISMTQQFLHTTQVTG